ncbi:hypothetical protein BY458DRAFT_428657 [Sporodiniella umbellata]|nr:hypothetical protein BY458DRAFT_428657 [Sporodiniella umbellata]
MKKGSLKRKITEGLEKLPNENKKPKTGSDDDQKDSTYSAAFEANSDCESIESEKNRTDLLYTESDSEEEINWETVELPEANEDYADSKQRYNDVEIVFEAPKTTKHSKLSRQEAEFQRNLREWTHNCHILTLVAHFKMRNNWCSNEKIRSYCINSIPGNIKRLKNKRSQLQALLKWWQEYFCIIKLGQVTRNFHECIGIDCASIQKLIDESPDRIVNIEDFLSFFVKKEGDSDTYSELFVALLRSLDFNARLVCSLQPLPYKVLQESKKNRKADTEEKEGSKPLFQYRTPRRTYVNLDKTVKQKDAKPPTLWTEIYCDEKKRWLTIDPVRALIDQPGLMEPAAMDHNNQLSFVLAFDGQKTHYVTDVTRRYTSNMDKAIRQRGRPVTKRDQAVGIKPWFEIFMDIICHKPNPDETEELEQNDLRQLETKEKMPTSIGAFKNHPSFVLERHLKKFEILHPKGPVLGSVRGEKVYSRECVKTLCSANDFRKQGREIVKGEQPLKMVKSVATTLEKKRMAEMAKQSGQEGLTPCYGEWQTQKIIPDPVINGKVPKNTYGNIDLFTPEMLPDGAVHIPTKGAGKIAKDLGVDYAEALTGFEFVKMRSVPIITGIVVAKEFRDVILDALEEREQTEAMKDIERREKDVCLRWRKLFKSLLIRARVESEYGKSKTEDSSENVWSAFNYEENNEGGGFLPEDDM